VMCDMAEVRRPDEWLSFRGDGGDHVIVNVRREPTAGDLVVVERRRGETIDYGLREIPFAEDGAELRIVGPVIGVHRPIDKEARR
jgi:hypothetical protein